MIQLIGIGLLAFLLFFGQKQIYKKIWNKHLSVDVNFSVSSIFEGQEGYLKEIIINQKPLPLSMLKVKFQTDRHLKFEDTNGSRTTDQYYRNDVFQISGNEKLTRTISFLGSRRGYYSIDAMDLVASDLFMTALYVDSYPVHSSLYVYPRPFDSNEFRQSLQQINGEVLTKRHLQEDPFEYRGVREYQPTDDMRSINWKATAKTGELKVNQKGHTALKTVRIFLNLEDEGILKKEDCVEASIQIVAGLCSYFINQGICVACYGNGIDILNKQPVILEGSSGKGQLEAVYRSLSRIDTTQSTVNFKDYFGKRLMEEGKGTVTFFVALNYYTSFLNLVEEYDKAGNDYYWFYPLLEKEEPQLPAFLQKKIRFLHLLQE